MKRSSLKGRPWLQTITGRAWCADAPEEYEYDIQEIAHALCKVNRFAGHTIFPYSVAHHSILVAEIANSICFENTNISYGVVVRAALIHDAAEAFVQDIPQPVKAMPQMAGYRRLIKRVEAAISRHFDLDEILTVEEHKAIKQADLVMLATEKRDVLTSSPHSGDWKKLPDPRTRRIYGVDEFMVKKLFLDMWCDHGGVL